MIKRCIALLGLMLSLGLPMAAQATPTLVGILPTTPSGTDYQAYYDTTTGLTWLANANMKGTMYWSAANAWADSLTITGYIGAAKTEVGGWSLPTTGTYCRGTGCTSSEMGNLFYNVLNDQTAQNRLISNGNYNPFSNIQDGIYWSATKYMYDGIPDAWTFNFSGNGYQEPDYIGADGSSGTPFHTWAVHSGDPAATSVPAPGSLWLMGAGFALLGLMLGRRRLALR